HRNLRDSGVGVTPLLLDQYDVLAPGSTSPPPRTQRMRPWHGNCSTWVRGSPSRDIEQETEQFMSPTQPGSRKKAASAQRDPRKHGSMITVRRSGARRHVRSGTQDTWLSFDQDNEADRFRNGFRTLEALNEETPASEMNLHPHPSEDVEIVTYVREGALVHQDRAGELGRLEAGEFQRTSARGKIRHRVINGSLLNPAHVFQSCITPDGCEFE